MTGFIEVSDRYGNHDSILIAVSEISSVQGNTIVTKSTVYNVFEGYREILRLIENSKKEAPNE